MCHLLDYPFSVEWVVVAVVDLLAIIDLYLFMLINGHELLLKIRIILVQQVKLLYLECSNIVFVLKEVYLLDCCWHATECWRVISGEVSAPGLTYTHIYLIMWLVNMVLNNWLLPVVMNRCLKGLLNTFLSLMIDLSAVVLEVLAVWVHL